MERPEIQKLVDRANGEEEVLAVLLQGHGFAKTSQEASLMAHVYITGEGDVAGETEQWDPS